MNCLKTLRRVLCFVLALINCGQAFSRGNWAFDLQSGTAYNFRVPLEITQGSYHKEISADYSTRPFGGGAAPYYSLRLRRDYNDEHYFSFEVLHHKLWLDNLPEGVDEFRMTFGYNPLLFSFGWKTMPWLNLYSGTGPVFAHPRSTVNGQTLPDSPKTWPLGHRYVFVGWGAQVGAEAYYFLNDYLFVNSDLKLTYSYAWRIPVVGGEAKTQQLSFHFHGGIGSTF